MRNKYILLVTALAALSGLSLSAQNGNGGAVAPEKQVVDLGASPAMSLEETTAAVSVITSGEIGHRNAKNIGNGILGQGQGLISLQNGGTYKDQNPTFFIRGLQTLNGNDTPLVLVDGIERDIASVSAEEVENVVILKDAAAVALYGYKGINGAIQISTKRGEYNTREVRFTYDHSFNSLVNKPRFVDGYNYGLAINEARQFDGLSPRYQTQELNALRDGTYPTLYPNVNWVDETFRNNAATDNLTLEFSGGESNFRYFALLDLVADNGFIKNANLNDGYSTQDKYVRGNLRLNMDVDLTPTTDLRVNILGMLLEDSAPGNNVDVWNMVYQLPSAAFPIRDADGRWAGSDTWAGTMNPVAQTSGAAYYKNHNRLLYTDLTLTQDLDIVTDGLSAFIKVGYDNVSNLYENHSKEYIYSVTVPTWTADMAEPTSTTTSYGTDTAMGTDSKNNSFTRRSHIEAGALYERTFGDHAVTSQLKWDYEFVSSNGVNNKIYRQNISWWTHYGYAGKYFADLTLMESGSSRLAPGTKWSFSPTASVAWLISKEDFMNADWVDYLKLRASAGLLNADYLPDGLWTYWAQQYQTSGGTYPFNSSFGSEFGRTYLGRLATGKPGHEFALKYNVGVDGRLFDGLSFNWDVYYQRRGGIWVDAAGKYTGVIGKDAPYENGGVVDSWGTEIGVDYTGKLGEVDINVGGNFNFNRNKIVDMLEEPRLYDNLVQTGDRVSQLYGMQAEGFFRDDADIAASKEHLFTTVRPGDIKYVDVNNDGKVDENDLTAIGYSTEAPEIFFNFHLGAEWKGLGFYALFQGAANYSAMLSTIGMYAPLVNNSNLSEYYYENRWTSPDSNAKFPRLSSQSNVNNYQNNTVFLADRSFLKLRNLEVYYNLPQNLLMKTSFIKGAKFYVQGNDLFSLDHLEVSDPEAYGIDQLFRSVVLGLKLTF